MDALTVAAVAERVGMAVGSIYRRFGDKEGLPPAIQRAFTENLQAEITERMSAGRLRILRDPAVAIAEAVGAINDSFQPHEALLRVFLLLGTRHEVVRAEGSRVSLDFAYRLIYATIAHRITQVEFLESDRPLPWNELRSQLRTAVASYLLDAPRGR